MSSPVNYLLLLLFAAFLMTSCCGAAGNISGTEKPVYTVGMMHTIPRLPIWMQMEHLSGLMSIQFNGLRIP